MIYAIGAVLAVILLIVVVVTILKGIFLLIGLAVVAAIAFGAYKWIAAKVDGVRTRR